MWYTLSNKNLDIKLFLLHTSYSSDTSIENYTVVFCPVVFMSHRWITVFMTETEFSTNIVHKDGLVTVHFHIQEVTLPKRTRNQS